MLQHNHILNIYNPLMKSKDESIDSFHVRYKELEKIRKELEQTDLLHSKQNIIIVGHKGSGKTTLLQRIFYMVKDDDDLCRKHHPIILKEEEYGVQSLDEFYKMIFFSLGIDKSLSGRGYKTKIISYAKKQRKTLLVLIDNIGVLLDKLTENEHHRLRELLTVSPYLRIVGASSKLLTPTYKYSEPFFDYFSFVYLDPLSEEDVMLLLKKIDVQYYDGVNVKNISERVSQVRSVRQITGGNTRLILLFYQLLLANNYSETITYIEYLLDQVTPEYKGVMDSIGTLEQRIMNVLPRNIDPVSINYLVCTFGASEFEIARAVENLKDRMLVSSIEDKAGDSRIVLKDRFFGIWYQMRYFNGIEKDTVAWLVLFFESWYGRSDELLKATENINDFLLDSDDGCDSLLAEVTRKITSKVTEENKAKFVVDSFRDLNGEGDNSGDNEVFVNAIIKYLKNMHMDAISSLRPIASRNGLAAYYIAAIYDSSINDCESAEKWYSIAHELGVNFAANECGLMHIYRGGDIDSGIKWFENAIEMKDYRGANNLGNLYRSHYKDYHIAENYYLEAINNGIHTSFRNLGLMYEFGYRDYGKAEKYYLLGCDKNDPEAFNYLGNYLSHQGVNIDGAEASYLNAIQMNSINALNNIACLYAFDKNELEKAEGYFLKALEEGHKKALDNLVRMYAFKGFSKGEKRVLSYAEEYVSQSNNPCSQILYAIILARTKRIDESVKVIENLIATDTVVKKNYNELRVYFLILEIKGRSQLVQDLFDMSGGRLKSLFQPLYQVWLSLGSDSNTSPWDDEFVQEIKREMSLLQ